MAGKKLSAVILDVTGVLYESGKDGGKVIKGSPEAVQKLREAGYKLKFCTNETSVTKRQLVEKLRDLGFDLSKEEVHSPARACVAYLRERNLRPLLLALALEVMQIICLGGAETIVNLVHPDAMEDYKDVDTSQPNCVVLADATTLFTYDRLNSAFQLLISMDNGNNQDGSGGSPLIALGKGRYYKEGEELTLDVGPFMAALEYATGLSAVVIGKPSPSFFLSALKDLKVEPQQAIMVGDDVMNDVGGAQRCGLTGILVRTGKYRPEDELQEDMEPYKTVDNLAAAVQHLLSM